MTPIEKITLDRMTDRHPNLKLLISQLDIDLSHQTSADILSRRVSNRIDQIIADLKNLPQVQRSILQTADSLGIPMIFQPRACIEAYLLSIYGPRPWKYPLTKAPF